MKYKSHSFILLKLCCLAFINFWSFKEAVEFRLFIEADEDDWRSFEDIVILLLERRGLDEEHYMVIVLRCHRFLVLSAPQKNLTLLTFRPLEKMRHTTYLFP